MRKFIITGATGFIGRHLVEELIQQGKEVVVVSRSRQKASRLFSDRVDVVEADLRHGVKLPSADVIVNLAGALTARSYRQFWEYNVLAVERLVEAARDKVDYLVHISSQAAAGPSKNCQPVDEAQEEPVSLYGRSKLEGERRAALFPGRKLILRLSAVYGPYDMGFLQAFRIIKKRVVPLVGGDSTFSIIYVRDLVRGMLKLIEKQAEGTVNISSPVPVTYRKFSGEACRILTGKKPIFLPLPLFLASAAAYVSWLPGLITGRISMINPDKIKEISYPCWILSVEKFLRLTGGVDFTPLEKGLEETLNWYKIKGLL